MFMYPVLSSFHSGYWKIGSFANSEDQGEMQHIRRNSSGSCTVSQNYLQVSEIYLEI